MPRYKFNAGCPACGDRTPGLWKHCSSYEEIDEDGSIYCLGCGKNLGFIMDLRYNCGNHDYQEVKDTTAVFQALAMMTDVPADFAKRITKKIMERLT